MISDSTTKPIVHIAPDEKFIDAAYDIYEKALPGKNEFIILLEGSRNRINHLSSEKDYEYIDVSDNYLSLIEEKVDESSILVFHGMNNQQSEVALSVDKKNITFIWTVFGYEVYSNPYLFGEELYGEKTYDQFVYSLKDEIKDILRPHYYQFLKGRKDPNKERLQAFKKMDYLGMLYGEELTLYNKKIGLDNDMKQLKFTYYPIDVVIDKNQGMITDDNILVGNSASYTNNHLESFDILKKMNLGGRKLITPLSYGNEEYAGVIAKEGNNLFGINFEALTEFLPLKKYQEILQTCGIVVMNHFRQQSVGNVLNTMYLGSKVFLSKKNTLYHYLKRIGCYVYCVEDDLVPDNNSVFDLLTKSQMEHNQKILKEELSLERLCVELQQKLSPLLN